jgi:hypothetical protein
MTVQLNSVLCNLTESTVQAVPETLIKSMVLCQLTVTCNKNTRVGNSSQNIANRFAYGGPGAIEPQKP